MIGVGLQTFDADTGNPVTAYLQSFVVNTCWYVANENVL